MSKRNRNEERTADSRFVPICAFYFPPSQVMQTLLPMRRACSSMHVDAAAIDAEIKRIEGVIEEMKINPDAVMSLLPAYGEADDDCPVRCFLS
jgi:hypothetical protein